MTAEDLKKSILQQAIQGKLVPQNSDDEPASALLERIREEKGRLISESKIKRDKNESIIFRGEDNNYYERIGKKVKDITDEIPFEIPASWEWTRFSLVADIARGGSPRPIKSYLTDNIDGVNWIKIGDTERGSKYINSVKEKIIPAGVSKSRMVKKGDFLLTNSMSFGRPYITNVDGCIHDGWLVISAYFNTYNQDFLYYLLSSPFVFNQLSGKVAGAVVKNLNIDKVLNALIPLPPINEQKRIVVKIEELLQMVDDYGKAQSRLDELNSSLQDQLKKSVLQYAIQGKLVPQNPDDEPASVLLKHIHNEKARLISEGKIKRDKHESVIFRNNSGQFIDRIGKTETDITERIPFEIPNSWEWVRMGQIGDWGAGATPSKSEPQYYGGNILWLRTGELNNATVYDTEIKVTDKALKECSLRLNQIGDVLIAMYGATIGKLAIVGTPLTTNQACCACTPILVYNLYLFYFLMASKPDFVKKGEGGAQPNISREKLINYLMPLPPLAEQKRIVERIEQIFSLCK